MEKVSRLPILFATILLIVIIGFYKSYFSGFPSFPNIKMIHHVHGGFFLLWMALLFIQPILIARVKIGLHRKLGKLSYILVPLILLSAHFVARNQYLNELQAGTVHSAVAGQMLPFMEMLVFCILYILAILNRRQTDKHMRYMIMTSLLFIVPGMGRILIGSLNFPFTTGILCSYLLGDLILAGLIIGDLVNKRPYRAYLVGGAIMVVSQIMWYTLPDTTLWQTVGGFLALVFF
jgi:hypothetical protein